MHINGDTNKLLCCRMSVSFVCFSLHRDPSRQTVTDRILTFYLSILLNLVFVV